MTTPPDVPLELKNDGDRCFKSGNYAGAIRCYLRALELDSTYIAAWNNLGYALSKSGRSEEAARCREKIAQLQARETVQGEMSPVTASGTRDTPEPAGTVRDAERLRTMQKIASLGRQELDSSITSTPELPTVGTAVTDADASLDKNGFWDRLKHPPLSSVEQDNDGRTGPESPGVSAETSPEQGGFWDRLKHPPLSSLEQDNDGRTGPESPGVSAETSPEQGGFWDRLRRTPKPLAKGNPAVSTPEDHGVATAIDGDGDAPSRSSSGLLSGLKSRIRSKTPQGQVVVSQEQDPQTARDALMMEGGEVFQFEGGRSVCSIQNSGQLVEGFDRVLEQTPDISAGFRGIALYSIGRYREALADFDQELGQDPGAAGIWILRARVLKRLGRVEEALFSCEQALRLDSDNFDAWRQFGFVLQSLGRDQEALHALDQALSLNPHSAEVWVARGQILHTLSRDHEALQSYDRALGIDARSSDLWLMRARVLARLGREEEALASLEQGIAANSDNPSLFICKGRMFHALGKFGDALAAYDQALTIRPDDAGTWEAMGGVLCELGKYRDAAASYDRALAIDPENSAIYGKRGEALARSGRLAEAARDFQKALASRPGDPRLTLQLGAILSCMEQDQEAARVLAPLLEAETNGIVLRNVKGDGPSAPGQYREALESYQAAFSGGPDHQEAREGLPATGSALAAGSMGPVKPVSLAGQSPGSPLVHPEKGDMG